VRLAVAENGRLVIPKPLRDAMHLDDAGMVTAFLDEDGVLMLVTPGAAIAKAQRMARLLDRGEGSVVDELIAERRAEAAREDGA
jgi:bifunctional DNA-binding transcriptional regulator/antitoxin component of YhaV-PrlF toxin-antitoxin module